MDERERLRARNDAMRAEVQALLDDYRAQRDRVLEVQERLSGLSARASSSDGVVTVTVGPRGTLEDLELSPYAYRQLDPHSLASRIVETARRAADEVAQMQQELVSPFVPAGMTDPATGLPDLARLLPSDPSAGL